MPNLDYCKTKLAEMTKEYSIGMIKKQMLLDEQEKLQDRLHVINAQITLWDSTRLFLQHISEYARLVAKNKLEEIVTNALQFVFGTQFSFKIKIVETRNRPEAEFLVCSSFGQLSIENTPQDSRGGGIVDVVSVALRIALLEVHYPKREGPIILDEPFKHVSSEYIDSAAKLLKSMSKTFDRQVIIITHNERLTKIADKLFEVSISDGVSKVVEVESKQ